MKFLIVVDAQIDFCTGALANAEAEARIPRLVEKIKQRKAEGYTIIFTQDSHRENYMKTLEGQKLPIPHCIIGTKGHKIVPEVLAAAGEGFNTAWKGTFGDLCLPESLEMSADDEEIEEIEIIGFVSSICVAANAIILRAAFPNTPIIVDASCCAGLEKADHDAAMTVLRCQQIDVIGE